MKKALKAAAAALALLATPALADTQDLFTSGPWTAFGGTADGGQAVCGIEEHGAHSLFAIKWFAGDTRLTIHFFTAHQFPVGGNIPVQMQFDDRTPWHVQALGRRLPSGEGTLLEFFVDPATGDDALLTFLTELRDSQVVRFSFPGSDVGDVLGELTGSAKSMTVFGNCISYVKKHLPPTTGTSSPVAPHSPPPPAGRDRAGTYL